jgi:agmatinase
MNLPAPEFAGSTPCNSLDDCPPGIAIIGAPYCVLSEPQPALLNTVESPLAIRNASADALVSSEMYDFDLGGTLTSDETVPIVDCGDIPGSPDDPSGNRARITHAISSILGNGAVPVVMGGDDSVPIAVLEAYEQLAPVTVVQIDAHLDWRDEYQGVRYGHGSTMRRISELPWVNSIIQIGMHGAGGATPDDYRDAMDWGARIVPSWNIHQQGPAIALDEIPQGNVFITLDCDGIDTAALPAATYPMPGGLYFHQIIELIDGIARRGSIIGFDVVEFAPRKDPHGLSALTLARIMINVIGRAARYAER